MDNGDIPITIFLDSSKKKLLAISNIMINNNENMYKLHERAIRVIDKNPRSSHTNPLFQNLKILKLMTFSFQISFNFTLNKKPFRPEREFFKKVFLL